MKTFRIVFSRKATPGEELLAEDGRILDETEFDTDAETKLDVATDLMYLFTAFENENHFEDTIVLEVYEVPYDGEEEAI